MIWSTLTCLASALGAEPAHSFRSKLGAILGTAAEGGVVWVGAAHPLFLVCCVLPSLCAQLARPARRRRAEIVAANGCLVCVYNYPRSSGLSFGAGPLLCLCLCRCLCLAAVDYYCIQETLSAWRVPGPSASASRGDRLRALQCKPPPHDIHSSRQTRARRVLPVCCRALPSPAHANEKPPSLPVTTPRGEPHVAQPVAALLTPSPRRRLRCCTSTTRRRPPRRSRHLGLLPASPPAVAASSTTGIRPHRLARRQRARRLAVTRERHGVARSLPRVAARPGRCRVSVQGLRRGRNKANRDTIRSANRLPRSSRRARPSSSVRVPHRDMASRAPLTLHSWQPMAH